MKDFQLKLHWGIDANSRGCRAALPSSYESQIIRNIRKFVARFSVWFDEVAVEKDQTPTGQSAKRPFVHLSDHLTEYGKPIGSTLQIVRNTSARETIQVAGKATDYIPLFPMSFLRSVACMFVFLGPDLHDFRWTASASSRRHEMISFSDILGLGALSHRRYFVIVVW